MTPQIYIGLPPYIQRDFKNENYKENITEILNWTANYFKVTKSQILGKCRVQRIALARQIAQYFLKQLGYKLTYIARIFNQHHTSVINSIKKIEDHRLIDKTISNAFKAIQAKLSRDHQ